MADAASSTGPQSGKTGQILVGNYVLDLDDPGGYSLTAALSGGDSQPLRRAIRRTKRQRRTHGAIDGVDDAAEVTSKIERGVTLYEELTSGVLDLASASDEIDGLVSLLKRLDREGRWEEELSLAHSLSVLLALIGRWMELLRSLRSVLHAAEEFGDPSEHAWVLHELGTVHLLAGKHAEADRLLGKAREIRRECGDSRGLRVTDGNLGALCKTLRQSLPDGSLKQLASWLAHNPVIAALVAAMLLAGGGTAGAVIAGSKGGPNPPGFHPAPVVAFSFAPSSPRAGQSIAFSATATDPQDPVASYTWSWGDGDPTTARAQRHVYAKVGKYRVLLTVKDSEGRVTGHVTHSVLVRRSGPVLVAEFSVSPRPPEAGSPLSFDGRSSVDPGSHIVSYVWQFGDGHIARGVMTSHVYKDAGQYSVSLSITDARGRRARLAEMVAVTPSRPVRRSSEIDLGCPPSTVLQGEAVTVSGNTQPERPDTAVTVTFSSSAHPKLTEPTTTDSAGAFTASATPETGLWSVQATMQGDSSFLPGNSEPCTFSVAAGGRGGETAKRAKEHEEQLAREKLAEQKRAAEARLRESQAQAKLRTEEREKEEAREREQEERVAAEEAKRRAAAR